MQRYITDEDVRDYGVDLVNFSQRAAYDAVQPALQNLEAQTHELNRRLAAEARARLDQQVKAAVPDLDEWDQDPRWHAWLRSRDSLSGQIRQTLLNEAIASTSTHRVLAFFREFRNQLTGQSAASSGQARSAGGPSGSHIYSTAEIGRLYEKRRKGEFDDATWNRIESDIFAAQKQNRVQVNYMTK